MDSNKATQNPIPRMRGLSEAINELHTADPSSGFTLHALRQAVKAGDVPCVRCGRKILVNMDLLFAYLYGDSESHPNEAPKGRVIVPIR